MKNGFTLVEMLVVISVLGIAGVLILNIFTSSLRGSNKTQIIGVIKQNGQAVLENMDKTIRGADNVVCINNDGNTITVVQNGGYTRFRFIAPSSMITGDCKSQNGCILEDFPVQPSTGDKAKIQFFLENVCTDPIGTDTIPSNSYQTLTDSNPQTGVSIIAGSFTKLPPQPGFKDTVSIQFTVKPGAGAPPLITGQIDDVKFKTTIQLR